MMSAKPLAIGLALALGVSAATGAAQEEGGSKQSARTEASPKAAGVSEQATTPAVEHRVPAKVEAPAQASDSGLRILGEVVGGVLAGSVAIGAGVATAVALDDQDTNPPMNLVFGVLVFSAVDLVLFPAGVTIGGGLAGGNGGYGWSFLGHLAGAVGGYIVGFGIVGASDPKNVVLPVAIEVLAAFTGGILGYELSHEDPSDKRAPGSSLLIAPSVMLLGNGRATLGLSGAF